MSSSSTPRFSRSPLDSSALLYVNNNANAIGSQTHPVRSTARGDTARTPRAEHNAESARRPQTALITSGPNSLARWRIRIRVRAGAERLEEVPSGPPGARGCWARMQASRSTQRDKQRRRQSSAWQPQTRENSRATAQSTPRWHRCRRARHLQRRWGYQGTTPPPSDCWWLSGSGRTPCPRRQGGGCGFAVSRRADSAWTAWLLSGASLGLRS